MTFIIAEVGSNWSSLEDCMTSISVAKQCGADAVKFQMFTSKEMFGFNPWPKAVDKSPIKEWLPKLKEKADACGIELMCTAFSPEGLRYVDGFVNRHKLASSDLNYPDLLLAAADTEYPTYLSTGASSIGDIALALNLLGSKVSLLYCVSSYPSTNVILSHIDKLRETFGVPVGYSCHTADYTTAVNAVRYHGATVIEKHFKLRDMDTPDAPHSLLPSDFKKMVQAIKEGKDKITFPHPSEIDMLKRHNRRLIATKPIGTGEALVYNQNFGCYRSLVDDLEGLSGFAYNKVNGKISTKDLKPGDAITPTSYER